MKIKILCFDFQQYRFVATINKSFLQNCMESVSLVLIPSLGTVLVISLFKLSRWGGRGGGMNWEIGTDIYTLICIK